MLHIKIHQYYVKKELLNLLRVYGKIATSAQTDGPLYTGSYYRFKGFKFLFGNRGLVSSLKFYIFALQVV